MTNEKLIEEFLENKVELSPQSIKMYRSGLNIFNNWVKENLDGKLFFNIKKKEFMKYLNWLTNRGLSEDTIKLKKTCVSSLCTYLEMMYEDEYPTFHSFVTADMKVVKTGHVHEKEPLTPDEIEYLCMELEKRGEWQKVAYVRFTYATGCRRGEVLQLKKEVVDYEPEEKEITYTDQNGKECTGIAKMYRTNKIRCKGASKVGKVRELKFDQKAMDAIKKWLEVRGEDDCPYLFVVKQKNSDVRPLTSAAIWAWCRREFTKIIGRRVHPHIFRESRATNLVVYEHRSSKVAQKLLGHESVDVTEKFYIINPKDNDESDEAFLVG